MKKVSLDVRIIAIVAVLLAVVLIVSGVWWWRQAKPAEGTLPPTATETGSPSGIPSPKILVIDRAAILRGSAVGLDIMKQV